jgi:hypothetical protein
MSIVADIWNTICSTLVPRLQEALEEPLTEKLKQLVGILEVVRIEEHLPLQPPKRMGRPRDDAPAMTAVSSRVPLLPRRSIICPPQNC